MLAKLGGFEKIFGPVVVKRAGIADMSGPDLRVASADAALFMDLAGLTDLCPAELRSALP